MLRITIVLWAALGAAAYANDCLYGGSPDVLVLKGWTAVAVDDRQYDLTIRFDYEGSRPTRMIDATLNMHDVLGNGLTGGSLDPDYSLQPGDSAEQHWRFSGDLRVTTVNKDDVVARLCTKAIVYSDGSIERFDQ